MTVIRDAIIVGAGIGGAVAGELLARKGRRVLVLERSTGRSGGGIGSIPRPEILWPRTQQVLAGILGEERLRDELTVPVRKVLLHDGTRWIEFVGAQAMTRAGVQPVSTEPARTRAALLEQSRFELRRGVEVLGLVRKGSGGDRGRIVGVRTKCGADGSEEELLARWVIGDDGSDSRVRRECGIDITLHDFPLDFLCFGFVWSDRMPAGTVRAWINLSRDGSGIAGALAFPFPDGKGGAIVLTRPRVREDSARTTRDWMHFVTGAEGLTEIVGERVMPRDFMHVRRAWGHAERYGVPGAVLIGDAAHPVSPAGGQGANMSVHDAAALSEIILDGVENVPDELEARRRAANARSVAMTARATALLKTPTWTRPAWAVRGLIRLGARIPRAPAGLLRYIATAFAE